ncbi:hypothetical protein [Oscillatoria nigro-viridis]|uniref:hypothetical protein n=1 Tax=Phormidium nigroviride TaxID=482564 RepID=UPI000306E953|nr:hypothetical protein [Oscillatoria nigro-viridis]
METVQWFLQKRNITVDFSTFETQLREQALGLIGMGLSTVQKVLFNIASKLEKLGRFQWGH